MESTAHLQAWSLRCGLPVNARYLPTAQSYDLDACTQTNTRMLASYTLTNQHHKLSNLNINTHVLTQPQETQVTQAHILFMQVLHLFPILVAEFALSIEIESEPTKRWLNKTVFGSNTSNHHPWSIFVYVSIYVSIYTCTQRIYIIA